MEMLTLSKKKNIYICNAKTKMHILQTQTFSVRAAIFFLVKKYLGFKVDDFLKNVII